MRPRLRFLNKIGDRRQEFLIVRAQTLASSRRAAAIACLLMVAGAPLVAVMVRSLSHLLGVRHSVPAYRSQGLPGSPCLTDPSFCPLSG